MDPYRNLVETISRLYKEGKSFPLGSQKPLPKPELAADASKALLFSPHPDDECIIGGLPLRLLREKAVRIVNVAVTQGSNKSRQQARLGELKACCDFIGFDLVQTAENGLEDVNPRARSERPELWAPAVERIATILRDQQPRIIFFPHATDRNSSHIGTHHLVVDALTLLGPSFGCYTVETEFWGAMDTPNLVVESSESEVVDLIHALTFHVAEVQRNPYHLRMPAWLMDNVRRGGELVGVQGGAPPDFVFATLYRLRIWREGGFQPVLTHGRFISCEDGVGELFQL